MKTTDNSAELNIFYWNSTISVCRFCHISEWSPFNITTRQKEQLALVWSHLMNPSQLSSFLVTVFWSLSTPEKDFWLFSCVIWQLVPNYLVCCVAWWISAHLTQRRMKMLCKTFAIYLNPKSHVNHLSRENPQNVSKVEALTNELNVFS